MSDDLNKLKYSNSLNCKLSNPNNVGKLKKPDTSNNNVIRVHIQHNMCSQYTNITIREFTLKFLLPANILQITNK